MTDASRFNIDFVAKGEHSGDFRMVLVEEGPWEKPVTKRLLLLQNRLYECIDAAIDGKLAARFPESMGTRVIIQVDCYDAPRAEVEDFFHRFSEGALSTEDYQHALRSSGFVSEICFFISFGVTH